MKIVFSNPNFAVDLNKVVKNFVSAIEENVMCAESINDDIIKNVLKAYNGYCENERGGIDYLFDINNCDDLKCVIDGGFNAADITELFLNNGRKRNDTQYFFCDCNHDTPSNIENLEQLKGILTAMLHEIVVCMLKYPHIECYQPLYETCVTNNIEEYIK